MDISLVPLRFALPSRLELAQWLIRDMPPCPLCGGTRDCYGSTFTTFQKDGGMAVLFSRIILGGLEHPAKQDEPLLCVQCLAALNYNAKLKSSDLANDFRITPAENGPLALALYAVIMRRGGRLGDEEQGHLAAKLMIRHLKHGGEIIIGKTAGSANRWSAQCLGCGAKLAEADGINFQKPGPFIIRVEAMPQNG